MDDGVHPPVPVDLPGEVPGLGGAAEVADHDAGRLWSELSEGSRAFPGAGVEQDLMAFVYQRPGAGES
jgi:hypothetical protein